jgi:integrase
MTRTRSAAGKARRKPKQFPKNIAPHGTGFRAEMQVGGKRVRSRTVATIEQAERLRDSMRKWKPGAGSFTLDAAIDLLRADLRRKSTSEATAGYYEGRFKIVLAAWPGETPLVRIDATAIERWADIRRDVHGVSPSTVHKDLAVLRRIFRLAVKRRRETGVAENPIEEVSMPTPRPERFGFLTEGEVRTIVERVRSMDDDASTRVATWDADIIHLLFLTGLRRAELARLTVQDIDVFRGKVRVRGKNEDRNLPIADQHKPLLTRLIAHADDEGCIVPVRGQAADARESRVDRALRRWRKRLGVRDLHPHALRHSFATWHVRNGTPPHVLRELLGHTTLQMTMRYYHSDGKEAREAMERMARSFDGEVQEAAAAEQGGAR